MPFPEALAPVFVISLMGVQAILAKLFASASIARSCVRRIRNYGRSARKPAKESQARIILLDGQ